VDVALLDQLWLAHAAQVHAYASRRVGPSAADDVVVDVFAIACRQLERVPDPAAAYLYGIAWKVVANHHRRERRHSTRRADAPTPSYATTDGDAYAMVDLQSTVDQALQRLNDREAEAVRLVAWEGLSSDEAAQALGCSPAAFRVTLSRARRRLRQFIEEDSNV
jgi:RNA polymerase sigma-70 factor, ECF subfamily